MITFQPNDRVEIAFGSYPSHDVWLAGEVESVGFLDEYPCARVWLDGAEEPSVHAQCNMRLEPTLGGLFGSGEDV